MRWLPPLPAPSQASAGAMVCDPSDGNSHQPWTALRLPRLHACSTGNNTAWHIATCQWQMQAPGLSAFAANNMPVVT
jgi:hypothetical protein